MNKFPFFRLYRISHRFIVMLRSLRCIYINMFVYQRHDAMAIPRIISNKAKYANFFRSFFFNLCVHLQGLRKYVGDGVNSLILEYLFLFILMSTSIASPWFHSHAFFLARHQNFQSFQPNKTRMPNIYFYILTAIRQRHQHHVQKWLTSWNTFLK